MHPEGFDPEVLADFLMESRELLEQIEIDLLDLESGTPSPKRVDRVYRDVHTLKGNASFLGLASLVEIAHAAETALDAVRGEHLSLSDTELDALLGAVDTIKSQLAVVEAGRDDPPPADRALIAALLQPPGATPPPSPAPDTNPSDPSDPDEPDPTPGPAAAASTPPPTAPDPPAKTRAPNTHRALRSPDPTVRVSVDRLDDLMDLVGELVILKNRVAALTKSPAFGTLQANAASDFADAAHALDRITVGVQVGVMKTRLQPVDRIFGRFPRLVRELARSTGKSVELVIDGAATEVDKSVIEGLADPLVHLLRNAVDHGIESPDERTALGKSATGTVRLTAEHEGGHVRITVSDDGRGFDHARIARLAVDRGVATSERVDSMTESEIDRLVFEPGFSTAERVSDISGRGVGLDVVRTNIERHLKGVIELSSVPGHGSNVSLLIPLTVAIMPAMVVAMGEQTYAIPLSNIAEVIRPERTHIASLATGPVVNLRGRLIPLIDTARAFGPAAHEPTDRAFVVVLTLNDRLAGLPVTRVLGQQDVVIKPLDPLLDAGPVSGATVRDDGGVSLILDVIELLRRAGPGPSTQHTPTTPGPTEAPSRA